MLARVDEIHRLVAKSEEVQEAMLHLSRDQSTQLFALSERVKTQTEHIDTVVSQNKSRFRVILDIKDVVTQLVTVVADFRVLLSNQAITRPLDPTRNLPLIVEDALGTLVEIPLDLVHSWGVLVLSIHNTNASPFSR